LEDEHYPRLKTTGLTFVEQLKHFGDNLFSNVSSVPNVMLRFQEQKTTAMYRTGVVNKTEASSEKFPHLN